MLGKLYLMGQGVEYDKKLGMYWLSQSAAQGNVYAKALLQRQDSGRPPHVFLAVTRLFHHMSRIFQERSLPQSGTGPQVDTGRITIKRGRTRVAWLWAECESPPSKITGQ